ncbi:DNA-binding protein [Lactobacillus delbrueckii subsp. lactis]|uniref:DNA-binding protein n=1 Tax=Lactobacillus delbrueckii TaxID=1584 RepID=UPI001E5CEC46|nr:DNA-binding protein [Lactobacillus delbrueckii]MCD5557575.1 DNA-binding protein [Lactobacillus delbrueckii subsp. lactis]
MKAESEYMNMKQTMAYLGLKSDRAFYAMLAAGLPQIIVGKSKRYSKRSIDQFMKEHEYSKVTA